MKEYFIMMSATVFDFMITLISIYKRFKKKKNYIFIEKILNRSLNAF